MFDLQNPLVFNPELLTAAGLKAAFHTIKRTCMGHDVEIKEGYAHVSLPGNWRVGFVLVSDYDNKPAFHLYQKKGWPCTDNSDVWREVMRPNCRKEDYSRFGELEFGLNIVCRLNDSYFSLNFLGGNLYEFDQKELITFSFILEAFTGIASNGIYHQMMKCRENAIQYYAQCAVENYNKALLERDQDIERAAKQPYADWPSGLRTMMEKIWEPKILEKPDRELSHLETTCFNVYAVIGDYAVGYSGNAYNHFKKYTVRHGGRSLKAGDTVTIGFYGETVQQWWILD